MSRETKIGLVVAMSFLSLVGVVVATKWRRGAGPTSQVVQETKPAPAPAQDNPPPPKSEPKKNGVVQADLTVPVESNPPTLTPVPTGANDSDKGVTASPLPSAAPAPRLPTPEELVKSLQAKIKEQDQNSGLVLPPVPMSSEPAKKADDPFNRALAKVDEAKNKAADVADKAVTSGTDVLTKGDNVANKTVEGAANKFDELLNKGNNAVNKGIDQVNKGLDSASKPLTLPPVVEAGPMPPPVPPPSVGNTPNPMPALPTLPAPAVSTPVNKGVEAANTNPPALPSLPVEAPKETPRPVIPAPTNPSLPMTADNKPGFAIPAPKINDAKVVVHDVRNHQVRAGETFASLSKDAYGSDKYANALLAYNREYSSNRNLTALQPGQMVMLPSAEFLQSKYPTALTANTNQGWNPMPTGPGVSGSTAVSISAPVPALPKANTGPTTPTPDLTKTYRVAPEGQMVYAIAIQTLGDGNRWPEILRLNPNMQPLQPVPGGTILRLPGNANVP